MTGDHERLIWSALSSIAGAIASLSFQSWKHMSAAEIMMNLFVAASFAFFVGPLVLKSMQDLRMSGAILYLMATGSNVLIPRAVRWLSQVFGNGAEPKGPQT